MATESGRSSLNGDIPGKGDSDGRWGGCRGNAAAAASLFNRSCSSCFFRLEPMPLTLRNMLPDVEFIS